MPAGCFTSPVSRYGVLTPVSTRSRPAAVPGRGRCENEPDVRRQLPQPDRGRAQARSATASSKMRHHRRHDHRRRHRHGGRRGDRHRCRCPAAWGCSCWCSPASPTCSTAPWPRPRATASLRGAFFDSVSDRLTDGLLFGGVAWYLSASGEPPWVVLLPVAGYVTASLVSYIRAKADALGFDARGGLVERAERFILLAIGLLFSQPADPGAGPDRGAQPDHRRPAVRQGLEQASDQTPALSRPSPSSLPAHAPGRVAPFAHRGPRPAPASGPSADPGPDPAPVELSVPASGPRRSWPDTSPVPSPRG